MVSRREDKIDFSRLEKELNTAVEMDGRYWRENDAKLRAVNQRVASYDEFRDIVLAAHIKPLEKGDKISEGVFQQPWNISADTKQAKAEHQPATNTAVPESSKLPKNSHEFTLHWRRQCKTSQDKCNFLISLGAQRLHDIFKTEIGFGLLGDICAALYLYSDSSQAHSVLDILNNLATVNRFDLSLTFLSESEKKHIGELMDKLDKEQCESEDYRIKLHNVRETYLGQNKP